MRPLERERATYNASLPTLLRHNRGRYVAISQDRILAIADREEEAVLRGLDNVGPVPFLVRRIERSTPPIGLPAVAQLGDAAPG